MIISTELPVETVSKCIFHCPGTIAPVCGTDSIPYHNACFLCRAACENPLLDKACDGDCPCKHVKDETRKQDGVETVKTTSTKRPGEPEEVVTEEFDSDGNKIITTKREGEPDKVVREVIEPKKATVKKEVPVVKKGKDTKTSNKNRQGRRGRIKGKRSMDEWNKSTSKKKSNEQSNDGEEQEKKTRGPKVRRSRGRHVEL